MMKTDIIDSSSIFIADAHSMGEDKFYLFLQDIKNDIVKCKELYLLGDIYELLFGNIEYIIEKNSQSIELLNSISSKIRITYFEGNHDFNLKNIFPKIDIIRIEEQPKKYIYKDKNIHISHGDTNLGFGYSLYSKIIRNKIVLKSLNLLDKLLKNKISKRLYEVVPYKARYNEIKNFKEIVNSRVLHYPLDKDFVVEGHYHQNKRFLYEDFCYINMPSFNNTPYKTAKNLFENNYNE